MTRLEICRERLDQWLQGLSAEYASLDDPRRELDGLGLASLRSFFALLLASEPVPPETPLQLLERAGQLRNLELYRRLLSLPLHGSPNDIALQLRLGAPLGELFVLQEALIDALDDEGRRIVLALSPSLF